MSNTEPNKIIFPMVNKRSGYGKRIDYQEIVERKLIIEFNRKPFDKYKRCGFLLDFSDDFTLLQELDTDWYKADGYCVFKNESVKSFLVYDKEDYFLNEVVKVKKLKPKPVPKISIESWQTILQTVNDNFDLVGVESEMIYKNQINIGQLEKLGKKNFFLKEISTSADWDDKPRKYRYKDLTLVSFGNAYNNTLWEISESRKK